MPLGHYDNECQREEGFLDQGGIVGIRNILCGRKTWWDLYACMPFWHQHLILFDIITIYKCIYTFKGCNLCRYPKLIRKANLLIMRFLEYNHVQIVNLCIYPSWNKCCQCPSLQLKIFVSQGLTFTNILRNTIVWPKHATGIRWLKVSVTKWYHNSNPIAILFHCNSYLGYYCDIHRGDRFEFGRAKLECPSHWIMM